MDFWHNWWFRVGVNHIHAARFSAIKFLEV